MKKFSDRFLAEVNVDGCRNAADLLFGAFTWDDSPQRRAAWSAVYNALCEIADAAEKKAAK